MYENLLPRTCSYGIVCKRKWRDESEREMRGSKHMEKHTRTHTQARKRGGEEDTKPEARKETCGCVYAAAECAAACKAKGSRKVVKERCMVLNQVRWGSGEGSV